jgi:hypothetical protein
MELKITQNIKPEDLMQGISWHGETTHDIEAVEKLKELNEFVSDLVAKVFLLRLQMEQVAVNQNSTSAKWIADEAEKLLVNVAEMTMEEENWGKVEQVLQEQKYIAENIAQFKDWSEAEIDILREIWKELQRTGGADRKVELNLDTLKETLASGVDDDTWGNTLETFHEKIIRVKYKKKCNGKKYSFLPFNSFTIDPESNKMTIETGGNFLGLFSKGKETAVLDFLNEVMTKL